MQNKYARNAGFTLVEMAIVLVIIGLLIGGVLKGQELIESAKVKNLAADFRNVPMFLYSYQDKFRALPGDDANAATHLKGATNATTPANSSGNGIIDGNWDSTTVTDESFLFWQHVRLAGLTTGASDLSTVTNAATALAFLPKNVDGGQIGIESGGAHYIKDVNAATYLPGTYVVCSSGILGKIAKQLDTLIDDGDVQAGSLRVVNMGHIRGAAAENTTTALDDATPYVVCMGM